MSIPFEHDTVRLIERTHRTLQEMTVKDLAFKPHLSSAYWGFPYQHNATLHNITSGNNNSSPYHLWHGTPFDLIKTPILPFGSIVTAHRPLADQTALSGRSREAIFVGIAPTYAGGITTPATFKSLKIIRTDNEFITSCAIQWALKHHICFKISIPFEHDTM